MKEMRAKLYGYGVKYEDIDVFFSHASKELIELLWDEIQYYEDFARHYYKDSTKCAVFVRGFIMASIHFLR